MGKDAPRVGSRLPAATLLESVLALGLLASAMAFAMALYFQLMTTDRSADRLQAWMLTELVLADPAHTLPAASAGLVLGVSERSYAPGLIELTITCTKAGKPILIRRCIQPDRP